MLSILLLFLSSLCSIVHLMIVDVKTQCKKPEVPENGTVCSLEWGSSHRTYIGRDLGFEIRPKLETCFIIYQACCVCKTVTECSPTQDYLHSRQGDSANHKMSKWTHNAKWKIRITACGEIGWTSINGQECNSWQVMSKKYTQWRHPLGFY